MAVERRGTHVTNEYEKLVSLIEIIKKICQSKCVQYPGSFHLVHLHYQKWHNEAQCLLQLHVVMT